jgi:hypothetical protein
MFARGRLERKKSGEMNGFGKVKKKSQQVEEINGVLWLLDSDGNKIKRVKKKSKSGDVGSSGDEKDQPYPGFNKRNKPSVREIDGVLWQMDSNGNPVKKVRRKDSNRLEHRSGEEPPSAREQAELRRRARSQGPAPRGRQSDIDDGGMLKRLRAQSLGRPRQKPGEYVDAKGRRVVIEADGNKAVFDKNGKRLRPKKKNSLPPSAPGGTPPALARKRPSLDDGYDFMKSSVRVEGNFDDVWSDKLVNKRVGLGGSLDPPSPNELHQNNIAPCLTNGAASTSLHSENMLNETIPNGGDGTSVLDDRIAAYGKENRDLKMQLMTAQDEVRTLMQQNQKEKAKNVKATTEMLQLKADYQQSSDEKHKMELQIKNLDARLREKEELLKKLEATPVPSGDRNGNGRKISVGQTVANGNGSGDHLVTQISDLMAENGALLDKLEFEKTASSHEIKKKDEQLIFLNQELKKLREENDVLFKGECEKDPLMGKLFQQKKELEDQLQQEKEVQRIRLQGMQEMIDSLQKTNADLKKELEKATLEIKDDDDDEIRRAKEMAQAVSKSGTKNTREARRASLMFNRGENLNGSNSAFGFGLKSLSELAQRK